MRRARHPSTAAIDATIAPFALRRPSTIHASPVT
jgi:hypothetical protein